MFRQLFPRLVAVLVLGPGVLAAAGRASDDDPGDDDVARLLALHEAVLEAHRQGDVELLLGDGTVPVEFVSAWIELYRKVDGRWMRTGNVSNFRP